jgi:glycosyltransferase involved in cell wall biosynthesis
MTNRAVLVVPGDLDSRTGGYIYDRHIADGLRAAGWAVDVKTLDDSFPRPTTAAVSHAAAVFDDLAAGTITLVDSLALGAIPEIIERHGSRLRLVALVHLPLAADLGIEPERAARFADAERRALRAVSLVIVTGRATLSLLAHHDLPRSHVVVIEPGTKPAPLARGSGGSPLQLLCVATLNQGKGHDALITALAALPSRNWQLTCAGSLSRHPPTVERVRAIIEECRLNDHVVLAGDLDVETLETCYDRSDLFVLATLRETYGMAVAEALAHGVPVVSTTTGAIPDLVGSEAGLLVPPGSIPALTDALARFINDPDLRARLAAGARRVRPSLPAWDVMVDKVAAALQSVEARIGRGGFWEPPGNS